MVSNNINEASRTDASDPVFDNCIIWIDTKEAAKFLRTSPGQIRNWVYLGKVPAYRLLGRKLLFKKSDLDRLIHRLGGRYEDHRI